MDPARFVGRAPVQVESFLRDWVDPLLDGAVPGEEIDDVTV